MNPQKVTEWLFSGEVLKGALGASVSGAATLYLGMIQIDHKINTQKIETESKIKEIEMKSQSDVTALYRYIDSNNEIVKLQFKYIADNISDIKKSLSK